MIALACLTTAPTVREKLISSSDQFSTDLRASLERLALRKQTATRRTAKLIKNL